MDSTNRNDENILYKEIEETAKANLKGIISEKQLGYKGMLYKEIKMLFKEKGIDWEPEDDSVSID